MRCYRSVTFLKTWCLAKYLNVLIRGRDAETEQFMGTSLRQTLRQIQSMNRKYL